MLLTVLITVLALLAFELLGLFAFRKKLRDEAADRIADRLLKQGIVDKIVDRLNSRAARG